MDHVSESALIDKQSSSHGRRRQRHRHPQRDRRRGLTSQWMRAFYFGLAALWGYALGAVALVVALRESGNAVRVDASLLMLVVPGALLALIGGMVSAAAYRQARRRHS
jgi:hypothetical protein